VLSFDSLDVEKIKSTIKRVEESAPDLETYELRLKDEKQVDIFRQYSELCLELKFLYVALTRAKKRVIIYDQEAKGRKHIQQYWEHLGAIEVLTPQMLEKPESMTEAQR